MIIEESDFKLIPVSESNPMFDLELLYTIKPKGKEKRLEFKNAAYGVSLEAAIKKIIQYRICSKHKEDAINLQTYLSEFKQQLKDLKNLFNI